MDKNGAQLNTKNYRFLQVKLLKIFSQFGLVYEVQVIDSSDSSEGNLFFGLVL